MNKRIAIGGVLGVVVVLGIFAFYPGDKREAACTLEAKLCPDGSSVGRIPPDCDFAPCPAVSRTEEREMLGFVRTTGQDGSLGIDEIQFLSGDEARRLGAEDTECPEERIEECIPSMNNDFYIRNREDATEQFMLADDAEIIILTSPGSPLLGPVTRAEFLSRFPRPDLTQPFKMTVRGNVVTRLEEQYTP